MADIIRNIVTRIDSTVNWTTLNPVPANGEQCIEILPKGLFKLKVGDGKTPWIALKYATMNGYDPRIGDLNDLITRDKSTIVAAINSVQEEVNLTEDDIAQIKLILKNVVPQYTRLPEASEKNLGVVAQYIGTTTKDYTHDYFYEVISEIIVDPITGEETTIYRWDRISVQPESDIGPVWEAIEELREGKIDDVQVKFAGSDEYESIVEDKVASLDLTSGKVDYTFSATPNVTSVKDALDDLMNRFYYTGPRGTFTVRQGDDILTSKNVEIGTILNPPFSLQWNLTNRTPDTTTDIGYYKYPDGVKHNNLSKSYDTRDKTPDERYLSNITSNTPNTSLSFSYYYEDNHTKRPAGNNDKTYGPSVSITFKSKMYFGVSVKDSLTDAEIRALSSEWCSNQSSILKTFGPFTNQNVNFYVYLVFPTAYCTSGTGIKFVEGFETNDYQLTQRNVETSTGLTNVQYNIYRFHANDAYPSGSTTSILIQTR